jgi:hypothetical protein
VTGIGAVRRVTKPEVLRAREVSAAEALEQVHGDYARVAEPVTRERRGPP